VWRILKAIQKAAADQSRAIRVPWNAKYRLEEALARTRGELRAELGREPAGLAEPAVELGISRQGSASCSRGTCAG
jgi:DNA-directed RNA polymerase sigma subunit (sigma70/sigma32)